MVKVFRKIRYGMLAENKAGKYVLYAIGEIILVVIGILIAIQLNAIKNSREKRMEEIIHLENLLADLKQDRVELDRIIERRISKSNSSKILEGIRDIQEVENLNDYYAHVMNVVYWDSHNPSLLTFNELINSGKLSSLTNERIKDLLLQIDYKYNELFEVRKHLYEDYWEYFYRPFADIIDYENAINAWSDPSKEIELSVEFVEISIGSKRIKNGYTLTNFNNNLLREKTVDIRTKVDSTITLIEEEINR